MAWYFLPPTVNEAWPVDRSEPLLWKGLTLKRGESVIVESGIWTQGRNFDQDRIAAADKYYEGGHKNGPLTQAEYDALVANGYGAYIITE